MSEQEGQDPPSPWRNSKAKQQLYDDILSGRTREAKSSTEVYYSRALYQRYDLKNFQTNYRNLKKMIESRRKVAETGRKAYDHDLPIILNRRAENPSGRFYYSGSDVQQQLREDVQRGETDDKTPLEVMAMPNREVYRQRDGLSTRKFADHLAYERRLHQQRLQDKEYSRRMRFINTRIDIDSEERNDEEKNG